MASDQDIKIDVPFMVTATAVINKHIKLIEDIPGRVPTHDNEIELLTVLMGLARCVEFNVRIGYESFFAKTAPAKYSDVRDELANQFPSAADLHTLWELVDIAAGGIVHGNFPTVETAVRRARAKIPSIASRGYPLVTIIHTVITKRGLVLDAQTGKAQDQDGTPIPATAVAVKKGNQALDNFRAFYHRGVYVNVYELLLAAIESAVLFREEAHRGLLPRPKSAS